MVRDSYTKNNHPTEYSRGAGTMVEAIHVIVVKARRVAVRKFTQTLRQELIDFN